MQAVMLCASSGVTPMKRSALPTSASLRAEIDVGRLVSVSMSKLEDMSSNFSADSSISVIS